MQNLLPSSPKLQVGLCLALWWVSLRFGSLLLHYMATFVSGFMVGFTAVWQLALVTLAVVPLIAVIGGIHAATLSKLSTKSQDALSQVGNIVEQVKRYKLYIWKPGIVETRFGINREAWNVDVENLDL